MAHTRWATHGAPTEANAHPHTDNTGHIALVHNGIIENYAALKKFLADKGHTFSSQTDTEVLAVLIGDIYADMEQRGDVTAGGSTIQRAVQAALHEVNGTYGIAVVCRDEPDTLVVARKGSPLIVGVGDDEYVVASDASAIVEHTRQVIYLNDNEMAVLRPGSFRTTTIDDVIVSPVVTQLENKLEEYELGAYEHYMLKEIFEQPNAIRNCLRGRAEPREGRIVLGGLSDHTRDLVRAKRLIFTAQGTAWHAGLVGDYLFEDLAKLPTECAYASEFRYRNPLVEEGTVAVAISQSGETADTLAALREAKEKGALAIGVVNVVGSTIARETDAGIYIHAGPEIGVASTKAFTCQLAVLTMMAIFVGRRRSMSQGQCQELIDGLCAIPDQIERVLLQNDAGAGHRGPVHRPGELAVPGPRVPLPDRAGGGVEAEGDQLHPRRGHARGGDEARPDRADQRRHAGRVRGHPGRAVRQGDQQHRGGPGPRRADHRRRHRGGRAHHAVQRQRGLRAGRARAAAADAERGAAAAAGVPRGRAPRVQRRQAAEPGQERDGRVKQRVHCPGMSTTAAQPVAPSPVRDTYRFGDGPVPALQPGTLGWTSADVDDPAINALWSRGRYEILDGVLTVVPPAYYYGGGVADNLKFLLRTHFAGQVRCSTSAEVDIAVTATQVVRADAVAIWGDDLPRLESLRFPAPRTHWSEHVLTLPPTLVIEAVSQGHDAHDRQTKRRWYAGFGVRHYWIVDGLRHTLDCLLLDAGRYRDDGAGRDGAVVRPTSLDGLAIPLADVWVR